MDAWNKGKDMSTADVEVVIAPPAVYCEYTRCIMRLDFQVMVQNVWIGKGGAVTGEVCNGVQWLPKCDFACGDH